MRHAYIALCFAFAGTLAGCQKSPSRSEVERAIESVNVLDEGTLNEMMLTVSDPTEAVSYFQHSSTKSPERIDFQRGLARSLTRAKEFESALTAWARTDAHPDSTPDDKVDLADAYIRVNQWANAAKTLSEVPPMYESFKLFRLKALLADSRRDWGNADGFYESAISLTTSPASTFNNWGYSKLTRGNYAEAERLFRRALELDPTLFTAKNNLVMARGGQRNYQLPVIASSQQERAELLYTLALTAIKQGDSQIGKALLREAIDTHPQHFDAAIRSLRVIEG